MSTAKKLTPEIHLYKNDLPDGLTFGEALAVDCEAMGLNPLRDRLCLVQMSGGDGVCHLVQIEQGQSEAPNLKAHLEDKSTVKIFHYARFDVMILKHALGIYVDPLFCTKIASKLVRTYTDKHGYKDVCRELVGVDISKEQQSSDWGNANLTDDQKQYAATDVLYLHAVRERLMEMLAREGRTDLAARCFEFLHARTELDLMGWMENDIFAHK